MFRSALAACFAITVAVAFVPDARAGALGDFTDGIRPDDDDRPRRRARRGDHHHHHDHHDHHYAASDEPGLGYYLILGDNPGEGFSWGRGPYDGRYRLGMGGARQELTSNQTNLSLAAPPSPRTGRIHARLEGLGLPDGSAFGGGIFAKLESSFTPGLAIWHQQLYDPTDEDRLGVSTITVEPRLWTGPNGQIYWYGGGLLFGAADGPVNGGATLGLGTTITPLRPLFLELRFAGSVLVDQALVDLWMGAGVEVTTGVFVQAGYRALAASENVLHVMSVGLTFDLGFGGSR